MRRPLRLPVRGARWARAVLGYAAMIAVAIVSFLALARRGASLVAPAPAGGKPFGSALAGAHVDVLLHVLLALLVILIAARLLGFLFRRVGQPPVIGEIVAGILLGPSLLGRAWPEASAFLLPGSVAPFLQVIAQVGVILYMFLVGVELDPSRLRRGHAVIAISQTSIVVPFLLGAALALGLYPVLSSRDVPFLVFALFLGVSMSVTAFPVLARILTDRGLHKSEIGAMALACAAVDDVSAWCLLALIASVVRAREEEALRTLALTVAFIAFVFLVLRPLVARAVRRLDARDLGTSANGMAFTFALLLAAALVTEWIGIHALFGAFLVGAVIPHDSRLAKDLEARLHDFVVVLLLPAFFAFSGLRTQIQLVSGASSWLLCGVIVLVACLGKFGGSAIAARVSGMSWRDASILGTLMNTRGLVELIVLNLGLDLGVISPTLFAMLVIMALVTTFATSPVIAAIGGRERAAFAQPSGAAVA